MRVTGLWRRHLTTMNAETCARLDWGGVQAEGVQRMAMGATVPTRRCLTALLCATVFASRVSLTMANAHGNEESQDSMHMNKSRRGKREREKEVSEKNLDARRTPDCEASIRERRERNPSDVALLHEAEVLVQLGTAARSGARAQAFVDTMIDRYGTVGPGDGNR